MFKVPATVITGFLGAGKTTLIRNLVRNANGRRLALVINEFGDVGIDADLVKDCADDSCPADDIIELANGCICCTVADDFLPTIEALLNRAERPDHIIIETSGLALPKPLVQAFNWPDIRTRTTVDGVIAVVDAEAVAAGRFVTDAAAIAAAKAADPALDHDNPIEEVFADQIACADLVILNKCDLLDPERRGAVMDRVARHARPGVRSVTSEFGLVSPHILLGISAASEADIRNRKSHHDEDDHDHEDFTSFSLAGGEVAAVEPLLKAVEGAIREHGILRLKGVVAVAGKPMRLVIQAVGARVQHYYDRPWTADEPRQSRLVVIGEHGLDRAAITRRIGLA